MDEQRCTFEFAPGVRCQMLAGHDELYYPYLDRGQTGEYSHLLSEGSRHEVQANPAPLPDMRLWTDKERRGKVSSYPKFVSDDTFPAPPVTEEPELEYGTRYLGKERVFFESYARQRADRLGEHLIRRRKAGPWVLVPDGD